MFDITSVRYILQHCLIYYYQSHEQINFIKNELMLFDNSSNDTYSIAQLIVILMHHYLL